MTKSPFTIVLLSLAVISSQALAEVHVGDTASALFDDVGGRSFDDVATLSGANWWDVSAGVGFTRSRSPVGTSDGTSKNAAIDFSGAGLGLRVYYKRWDATPFSNQTVGTRLSWTHDGFTLSGIAEARDFDLDY